jgi:hypothetical protein
MNEITITATYMPGDVFYAAPLNSEYLQAKRQAGAEVELVGATTSGIRDDASYTHTSVWRIKDPTNAL